MSLLFHFYNGAEVEWDILCPRRDIMSHTISSTPLNSFHGEIRVFLDHVKVTLCYRHGYKNVNGFKTFLTTPPTCPITGIILSENVYFYGIPLISKLLQCYTTKATKWIRIASKVHDFTVLLTHFKSSSKLSQKKFQTINFEAIQNHLVAFVVYRAKNKYSRQKVI